MHLALKGFFFSAVPLADLPTRDEDLGNLESGRGYEKKSEVNLDQMPEMGCLTRFLSHFFFILSRPKEKVPYVIRPKPGVLGIVFP